LDLVPLKWVRKGSGKGVSGVGERGCGPLAEEVARHY